ncbi:hypothetical protein POL67_39550 [Polyangium sp. rjm3]|uniref:Transcriptional regulator SbtR-like C-terminal domain-containing protein n=1 Tax=Polyangium mundeleinium TaxID=2995306 RepID=A0ABT5F1M2_9BACT|nr:hypothetical protein [Polyangium mundeleinium]MDC0747494.1 hypothetical protein [Polyangium mundeleinium]
MRAQAEGEIRRDVDFEDVVCMAAAISLASQGESDTRRIRRLVGMFVDGLRAPAGRSAS